MRDKLAGLYEGPQAERAGMFLEELLARYGRIPARGASGWLSEQDVFLITYADGVRRKGEAGLVSLRRFVERRLRGLIGIVHLLPFFPYSSDDGFAVIDYRQVKPEYGDWEDVERLAECVDLCFDLVINHVSASSHYVKGYLQGDPAYKGFFIEADPEGDYHSVLRPRALPLLHRYDSVDGPKWLWTTFSADQVDWNFKNPAVLREMLDILLFYAERGARIIRLDAIAYLWKELGTSCAHLPQTHLVVKLMRDVLDEAAPHVLLLTETNVPHRENISYFGDGRDEAQIVYNFPLPPLVLHTLTAQNARRLTAWAQGLAPVSERTTFLNLTASHDGIGVQPVAEILDEEEFRQLVAVARRHGGDVSYKVDSAGRKIPYELNITYYDAINNPREPVAEDIEVRRFLLSQSIALVLQGMPAIYMHSLVGSRNWQEGVRKTGHLRSINREKLDLDELERELDEAGSRRAQVFAGYAAMIRRRREEKAFHPNAGQNILDLGEAVFAVRRTSADGTEVISALHNVTGERQEVRLEPAGAGIKAPRESPTGEDPGKSSAGPSGEGRGELCDLLSGERFRAGGRGGVRVVLEPYQIRWLKGGKRGQRQL